MTRDSEWDLRQQCATVVRALLLHLAVYLTVLLVPLGLTVSQAQTSQGSSSGGESWFQISPEGQIQPEPSGTSSEGSVGWFGSNEPDTGQGLAPGIQTTQSPEPAAANALCDVQRALISDASERIENGIYGEGNALLSVVDITGCHLLAGELTQARTQSALGQQRLAVAAEQAIAQCDATAMGIASDKLARSVLPDLQGLLSRTRRELEAVDRGNLQLVSARQALRSGDLANARRLLMQTPQPGRQASCGLIDVTQRNALIAQLDQIEGATVRAEQALNVCDIDPIQNAIEDLRGLASSSGAPQDLAARLAGRLGLLRQAEQTIILAQRRPLVEDPQALLKELQFVAGRITREAPIACARLAGQIAGVAKPLDLVSLGGSVVETALQSCAEADLGAALSADHSKLGVSDEDADRIYATLNDAFDIYQLSSDALDGDNEEEIRANIDRAIAAIEDKAVWYCPNAVAGLRLVREKIAELTAMEGRLSSASRSCDTTEMFREGALFSEIAAIYAPFAPYPEHEKEMMRLANGLNVAVESARTEAAEGKPLGPLGKRLTTAVDALQKENQYLCEDKIAEARQLADQFASAEAEYETVDATLKTCWLGDINRYIDAAETLPGSILSSRLVEVRVARKLIIDLDQRPTINKKKPLVTQAAAFRAFLIAQEPVPNLCPDVELLASYSLSQIEEVQIEFGDLENAASSCDLDGLKSDVLDSVSEDLVLHFDVIKAIDAQNYAYSRCRASVLADVKRQCVNDRGTNSRVTEGPFDDFVCGCKSDYQLSDGRCVANRKLVMRDANKACRTRHGTSAIAENVRSASSFNCGCSGSTVMTNGRCANPTGAALKTLADASCKKQFGTLAISTDRVSISDYQCTCPKKTKWSKDNTHCYRPSVQELIKDGWAWCRNKYGRKLTNTIVQKDGTFTCYYRN